MSGRRSATSIRRLPTEPIAPERFRWLLQNKEGLYRDLVEHSLDLLCVHTLDGRLLSVNKSPARLLGYEVDELLAIPMAELIAPEFRHEFPKYLATVQRDGIASGHLVVLTKTGERRIWEYHNQLRKEDVPEPVVRGIAHDVTERVHAEQDLRRHCEEANFLRELGEMMSRARSLDDVLQAVVGGVEKVLSPDLFLLFIFEQGIGLSLKAVAGPLEQAFRATNAPVHQLGHCLCGLAARELKCIYCTDVASDPRCTWDECKRAGIRSFAAIPLRAERDSLIGVLGLASSTVRDFGLRQIFIQTLASGVSLAIRNSLLLQQAQERAARLEREIAERHKAERSLREHETTFLRFVDACPAGMHIYRLDERGDLRLIGANPAADKILGLNHQALIGKTLEEAFPPLVATEVPERYRSIAAFGGTWNTEQVEYKDEKIRGAFEVHAFQTIPGSVGVLFADVGERRLLQEQFYQSQKMEAVGRLAGGVAHDFNNLLGVILGYTEILSQEIDPKRHGRLEHIKSATRRAADLTAQLLAFSRKQVLDPKIINLNNTVSEISKMLQRLIGEDIHLDLCLTADPWTLKADPSQLGQVLMNLAVNARDAMPQGGRLTIATSNVTVEKELACRSGTIKPGEYVVLAVSDCGSGMDLETQAKLFDPFFTTKPSGKGTGLGLATVYGIVCQAGGYITFTSEVGRGTTFSVYFPRSLQKTVMPARTAQEDLSVKGSETILLAEDTASLREFLGEGLQDLGYKVLTAADGAEALKKAAEYPGPIHLLITDVIMPNGTGPNLASRVLAMRPTIKVLYMSGYTDDRLEDVANIDPESFIQKPFTLTNLTNKIRFVLRPENVE